MPSWSAIAFRCSAPLSTAMHNTHEDEALDNNFDDVVVPTPLLLWHQAAQVRLASANAMLSGERGAGRLRRLKRALVARRARMVAQLGAALGLGFHTGVPCAHAVVGRPVVNEVTVSQPAPLYPP